MSHSQDVDDLTMSLPRVQRTWPEHTFSDFLTYLAFEGHTVRVGLELTSCVVMFQILELVFPWTFFGVAAEWKSVWSWFTACILVILFDQLCLCRAVYTFRKVYQLSLAGAYEAALALLEKIAPERKLLVRCPATMFHLVRAEILAQAETFRSAERELELAEEAGAKGELISIMRSRLYLLENAENAENAFSKAQETIQEAKEEFGDTSVLCLEEALLMLEQHSDLWEAKRALKRVCSMPDQLHYSGDTTSQIARAGLEATRLWTGEAEEGLNGLNVAIERLRSMALYLDTLRPILALLHLERSLYLATHKEPELAGFDLRMGLALCNYPHIRKKAMKVQEELAWRHKILQPA
ncbi:MAG: hypothetical protein U0136_16500 [Bdellovibrionota bacterium]